MCGMCGKGELVDKNVTFTMDDEDKQVTVLIHDVPAKVCENCGERFFDGPIVDEIGRIFRSAVKEASQVGKSLRIVTYRPHETGKATRRPVRRKTTTAT